MSQIQGTQRANNLKDTINLRRVKKQPVLDAHMTEQAVQDTTRLVLTRQLGLKQIVKGLGQWRLQSEDESKCWVCNHTNSVLIFWNTEL